MSKNKRLPSSCAPNNIALRFLVFLTLARQPVRHQGVPVVQGRGEVVEQQQREVSRPAEAPIGEPDASDLNEFGGSRFMRSIGLEDIP
jgi:hypothetical protein